MKSKTWLIAVLIGAGLLAILIFVGHRGFGYIKVEAPGFETDVNLRGRWSTTTISASGNEPIQIRAGTYRPERVVLRLTKQADQWWSILCRREPWGQLATIKVARGKTTTLKLGPPLAIHTDVQRKGQTVSIGLSLAGRAGEQYSPQVLTNNGPLPAPNLRIVDEAGKVLAVGKFEYG